MLTCPISGDSGDYEHIYSEIYEDLPPPIPLPIRRSQSYEIPQPAGKDGNDTAEQQTSPQYSYAKQPISVIEDQYIRYSQMRTSPTPNESVQSTGVYIYAPSDERATDANQNSNMYTANPHFVKDQELSTEDDGIVCGHIDQGTYIYSDNEGKEYLGKGKAAGSHVHKDQQPALTSTFEDYERSLMDNGTYIYSEKITCDQPDMCNSVANNDTMVDVGKTNEYDDISVHNSGG